MKERRTLAYMSSNIKPIGVKKQHCFEDTLSKEIIRKNKSNKVVRLIKLMKDKENTNYSMHCKKIDTSQASSYSFLL